jgi:hypothetical protein
MLKEELYTQSQVDAIEYLAKGFAKSEEQARIIKLLEEMPMMIYYAVAHNGRILDKPCSPVVI